jgi:cytochrome P450
MATAIPAHLGLIPELNNWFYYLTSFFMKENPILGLQQFGQRAREDRKAGNVPSDREDFLVKGQKLVDAGKLTDQLADRVLTGNVIAGSDTTGITLAAALYYLMRNPESMRKLQYEFDEATRRGELSQPATYAEASKLSYLQAVIKETLRIHPAVGMLLSRVVPEGGKELAGHYFPAGVSPISRVLCSSMLSQRNTDLLFSSQTVVGVNAWAIHRNTEIFGPDVDLFRPERWLGPREKVARMDQHSYAVRSLHAPSSLAPRLSR